MRRYRILLLLVALMATARAHVGMESSTEVRLYPDRLQAVVRTSFALAWKFLGARAPEGYGEAERKLAQPMLMELAGDLFEVTADGRRIPPTRIDCQFELDQDVAFVLVYPKPQNWPVVFHARYLRGLGPLDSAPIAFFDQTGSPRLLVTEPLSGTVLMQGKESFAIQPQAPAAPLTVATDPSAGQVSGPGKPAVRSLWLLMIPAVLAGLWWGIRLIRLRAR